MVKVLPEEFKTLSRYILTISGIYLDDSKAYLIETRLGVLLKELGCEVVPIGCEPDGLFPRNPEPVPENLSELCQAVKKNQSDIGFACDPQALGIILGLPLVDSPGIPGGIHRGC